MEELGYMLWGARVEGCAVDNFSVFRVPNSAGAETEGNIDGGREGT